MSENIRLAFQGIWGHKMRSLLTMLGIIIGIASIISIVSTIKGTNEQIKQNLIGSGNNVVDVKLCQNSNEMDFSYDGIPSGLSVLSDDLLEKITALNTVQAASYYTQRSYADNIYYQNTSYSGNIKGVDDNYLKVYGYKVSLGRPFADKDYTAFHKVALVDTSAANSLFSGENPIGKTIEINKEPFAVIGMIELQASSEPVINNYNDYQTYTSSSGGTILIPSAVWPVVYQYDEPQNVAIRATSTDDMTTAGKGAEDILAAGVSFGSSTDYAYKSMDIEESAKQLQQLANSSNQQLIWIASISLLVGGIGVMNIMLVSVTERTREIGLKKALGAKKRRILMQFLTEASVLTSFGGILGVICGIILAQIISQLTGTPTAVSVPAILVAVLFSVFIGVVFGVFPAVKAANLNPIDALRRE